MLLISFKRIFCLDSKQLNLVRLHTEQLKIQMKYFFKGSINDHEKVTFG